MSFSEPPHLALGRAGERRAEQVLRRLGLKVIARRFGTPMGELDLVMRAGDTLVFVEVKTRAGERFAAVEEAVTRVKQQRLIRAARWFLHQKGWEERPCRFDVVAIVAPAGSGDWDIRHYPDAFTP